MRSRSCNDDSYPGLQLADMISYESRRLMVEKLKNSKAEPSELFQSLTLLLTHQPHLYTPEVLDKMHADAKEKIANGSIAL
jgi:hypothetical protein